MLPKRNKWKTASASGSKREWRVDVFLYAMIGFAFIIVLKLFFIQVIDHGTYKALADGEHSLFQKLYPERGQVFVHDGKDNTLVPVITNQQLAFLYADPRYVKDATATAQSLGTLLNMTDDEKTALTTRLSNSKSSYAPIQHGLSKDELDSVNTAKLPGVLSVMETSRLYPEAMMGGQILGFVGSDKDGKHVGRYGIEGYFDKELSGTQGFLQSDHDISGRMIAVGDHTFQPAVNGSDIVLTLDRTIQFKACSSLAEAVQKHGADGGSIVIVDPNTGRILAMCGAPDFDPNHFNACACSGQKNI